jgi:hypothetical protein
MSIGPSSLEPSYDCFELVVVASGLRDFIDSRLIVTCQKIEKCFRVKGANRKLRCDFLNDRQRELKHRAPGNVSCRPQSSAMCFDD